MEGNRSSENCYLLGHINHNNLRDNIVVEAIRGVPNLKAEPERMCDPCQLGKQTRTSHIEF